MFKSVHLWASCITSPHPIDLISAIYLTEMKIRLFKRYSGTVCPKYVSVFINILIVRLMKHLSDKNLQKTKTPYCLCAVKSSTVHAIVKTVSLSLTASFLSVLNSVGCLT